MELVTVSSENERAGLESRKTYRVETFIIPKGNKVFCSTKDLDLEFHDDEKQPNDVDDETKLKEQQLSRIEEKGTTAGIPEVPQSRNPKDRWEFDLQNTRENFAEFNPTENGGRMGDDEAVAYLEKSLCGGGDPHSVVEPEREAGYFKGCDDGDFDPFLGMKCLDFAEEEPRNIERSRSYDFLPSLRSGSDLKSIKESSCETMQPGYGSCEELCHHGNRNGCTVAAQSPNKVSEVIFKENWMQRLELLRRRVSLIREKEVMLQERERLLLKKEKELRILERLVKEKIQRADLYLKRCTARTCHSLEEDELDSRPSPPPYPDRRRTPDENEANGTTTDNRETGSRTSSRSNRSKGSSGNSARSEPSVSIGHQEVSRSLVSTMNVGFNGNPGSEMDRCRSKWSAYESWRCRAKPKVCYDDLDSTLSADVGDSSFAITSKKLDPRLVRRPRGFARSASERGPKSPRPRSLDLDADRLDFESGKVLRKISENISAVVLDQGTRFQDYGSIDRMQKLPGDSTTDVAMLGVENKADCGGQDQMKSRTKEKASFWNEEASDWLRKKRQAYNLATKRMANRDFENDKENLGKHLPNKEKSEKIQKPKNDKGKKFTIFR